jgi:DNA polymerase-1
MILILDSNFLCHRSKHAMKNQDLSHERMRTEVIYNFCLSIFDLAKRFEPDTLVFVWDSRKSKRREIYPRYKPRGTKEKTPEEKFLDDVSYPQFNEIRRKLLPGLGFKNNFIQTGYEGDDIMASIVMNMTVGEPVLVSSDNDLLQLLGYCDIFNAITKKTITRTIFEDEWGIEPHIWADVKSIAGCGGGKNESGDNVQGIDGVGEKTAIKYLKKTLNPTTKAFQNIDSSIGKEIIETNLPLVKLPFEGTQTFTIQEDNLYSRDFISEFERYGFQSFMYANEFRQWERIFKLK